MAENVRSYLEGIHKKTYEESIAAGYDRAEALKRADRAEKIALDAVLDIVYETSDEGAGGDL